MTSSSRIEQQVLVSKVLEGNLPGDPHERSVPVYVPPGYDDDPQRRYPVLYLLTGYGGNGHTQLNYKTWDENLPEQFDRLVGEGAIEPLIIVLPDCWTRYGGSQYLNSSALGRYEDYLIDEIVPFVDANYRTLPDKAHRAVLGKSSGGYGALVQGMHHPDVFGVVGCQSGDMYFEYCYMHDIANLHANLASYGGWPELSKNLRTVRPKGTKFYQTMGMMAYGMAYAPNPDAPGGFDMPIDLETGALVEAVWARWLTHDPLRKLDEAHFQDALRSLKLLYIDAGEHDEFSLQVGARLFAKKLEALGIAHRYEEFPGGHFDLNYRYDEVLPVLSAALQP